MVSQNTLLVTLAEGEHVGFCTEADGYASDIDYLLPT
jgi:hypothetical protein